MIQGVTLFFLTLRDVRHVLINYFQDTRTLFKYKNDILDDYGPKLRVQHIIRPTGVATMTVSTDETWEPGVSMDNYDVSPDRSCDSGVAVGVSADSVSAGDDFSVAGWDYVDQRHLGQEMGVAFAGGG